MAFATALALIVGVALAVLIAEIARRAVTGRAVDDDLRRTAALAPLVVAGRRVGPRDWGRRAA